MNENTQATEAHTKIDKNAFHLAVKAIGEFALWLRMTGFATPGKECGEVDRSYLLDLFDRELNALESKLEPVAKTIDLDARTIIACSLAISGAAVKRARDGKLERVTIDSTMIGNYDRAYLLMQYQNDGMNVSKLLYYSVGEHHAARRRKASISQMFPEL